LSTSSVCGRRVQNGDPGVHRRERWRGWTRGPGRKVLGGGDTVLEGRVELSAPPHEAAQIVERDCTHLVPQRAASAIRVGTTQRGRCPPASAIPLGAHRRGAEPRSDRTARNATLALTGQAYSREMYLEPRHRVADQAAGFRDDLCFLEELKRQEHVPRLCVRGHLLQQGGTPAQRTAPAPLRRRPCGRAFPASPGGQSWRWSLCRK